MAISDAEISRTLTHYLEHHPDEVQQLEAATRLLEPGQRLFADVARE